jgi:hypothetical protein
MACHPLPKPNFIIRTMLLRIQSSKAHVLISLTHLHSKTDHLPSLKLPSTCQSHSLLLLLPLLLSNYSSSYYCYNQ